MDMSPEKLASGREYGVCKAKEKKTSDQGVKGLRNSSRFLLPLYSEQLDTTGS